MADFKKAKGKIDKVIFELWRRDPVVFGALCLLDKIEDPAYDTMGIDVGHSHKVSLRYNPNFVNEISIERLELVLVVEAFRVLLRHCTTRLREPGNISQLSSSLSINQLMNSDIEKLLQGGFEEITPSPKDFNLKDNGAFEEYFRELLERQDKTEQQIQKIWNSMSEEEKENLIQNAMQGQGEGEGDSQSQGQGEGDPQSQGGQGKDSEGFKEFKNEMDAMKNHTDPNNNSNQNWGKNDSFDADVKTYVDKVKNKTKQWGKYSGDAQAEILASLQPKVSCKDIIRKFSCSVITGKTLPSRMKISRRWDIERPGYRRIYKPHVIFSIDVSGSMSDEDLANGFSVVNRLLHFAKLTFVEFDTEIKKIEKNLNKARKSFKVHGRGGTDFHKIIDLANQEKSDGLIIYTDGYAPAPPEPRCKVLWLMQSKETNPPVSWGMRAWLDRFEDNRTY